MIDLPKHLTNGLFDKELKRGSVLKTIVRGDDGKPHRKYLVILNKDISKDPIVFVFTTSKSDFYNKNPSFNRDMTKVTPREVSFFQKETIINCRKVHRISAQKLKINFQKGRLEFSGNLLPELMREIDNIVLHSFFIPNGDKRLILGDMVNDPQNPLPLDNPSP